MSPRYEDVRVGTFMKRREFITLLGGAAASWPFAARAQQAERIRRIGVLMTTADDHEGQRRLSAFREGLEKRGWLEGKNVSIEVNWSVSDPERARSVVNELLGSPPDLILTSGTSATKALHQAAAAIPVVFTVVSEPAKEGFVESLAHPGGNFTGFSNLEPSLGGKWIELLKEIAPNVTRAAIIFNPQTAPAAIVMSRSADEAAEKLAIELVRSPVRDPSEIESTITSLRHQTDGLVMLPDTFVNVHRKLVVELAARCQLPAVYPSSYLVAEGGLASYGIDLADSFRQAAVYVDRIFHGEKAANLPVQQPTKFDLAINLKTAKALDLIVPATLLARADEVIE
jgi:putative tryptophan/tyrosine transport system substrate-binding protein